MIKIVLLILSLLFVICTQAQEIRPTPLVSLSDLKSAVSFLQTETGASTSVDHPLCGGHGLCPHSNGNCCNGLAACCAASHACAVDSATGHHHCRQRERVMFSDPKNMLSDAQSIVEKEMAKDRVSSRHQHHALQPESEPHLTPNAENESGEQLLSKLRSLSTSRCDDVLSGYLVNDVEKGQPRLNVKLVESTVQRLAKVKDIQSQVVGHVDGYPIHMLRLMSRQSNPNVRRVFISSGVHGNEPIGVTSVLELVANLYDSPLRDQYEFTFVPMMNPGGLNDNMRTMRDGQDLNRQFDAHNVPQKLENLGNFLRAHQFVLSLDVHGAKLRSGFFVIKAGEDQGLVSESLQVLDRDLLLASDSGTYPGFVSLVLDPHRYHLTAPGDATSNNQGTVKGYLYAHNTPHSYTVEYPGHIPVCQRQVGLIKLLTAMVANFDKRMNAGQVNVASDASVVAASSSSSSSVSSVVTATNVNMNANANANPVVTQIK